MASVPLATPTAPAKSKCRANSCSNARTSFPRMYQPLSRTRTIAAVTSSLCSSKNAPGDICEILDNEAVALDIITQPLPVELYSAGQSVLKRHSWRPPCELAEELVVRKIIADVDAQVLGWKLLGFKTPSASKCDKTFCEFRQGNRGTAADVKNVANCGRTCSSHQESFHGIVHVGEIALLPSVPHLEHTNFYGAAQPNPQ